MPAENLRALDSHFKFGENWASYAAGIDEEAIAEAERGLVRLVGREVLRGRTFLDIGCGSGLHALAALRLGAARVLAVDIDPRSVETAAELLGRLAPHVGWEAKQISVFDLDASTHGTFDVVYSWGVLHHTGAMEAAVRRAADLVAGRGLFVFALYRKTRLDPFWIAEKRWYTSAGPRAQKLAESVYTQLLRLRLAAAGRSFAAYEASKKTERGMDLAHDVRDWLGGYPYEAISPTEVVSLMSDLGFRGVRSFAHEGRPIGLFGSGCDEYVYQRA